MKYKLPELNYIQHNMERYGGSFVKALAVAMRKADADNLQRIVEAFPEIMEKYAKMKR